MKGKRRKHLKLTPQTTFNLYIRLRVVLGRKEKSNNLTDQRLKPGILTNPIATSEIQSMGAEDSKRYSGENTL